MNNNIFVTFKLTNIESNSPLWMKLSEQIKKNIETLRMKNDHALVPEETAKLRGQIAAYKTILSYNPLNDGNAIVGE